MVAIFVDFIPLISCKNHSATITLSITYFLGLNLSSSKSQEKGKSPAQSYNQEDNTRDRIKVEEVKKF